MEKPRRVKCINRQVCVEFDKNTATFFNAIGDLINAFSIHEKRGQYELKSIAEEIGLVDGSLCTIKNFESDTQLLPVKLPRSLTGNHAFISTKSCISHDGH